MVKKSSNKSSEKIMRQVTKGNKTLRAASKTILKAKTHKGRKVMESRENKNIENSHGGSSLPRTGVRHLHGFDP